MEPNAQPEIILRGGIPPGFGNQAGRAQEPVVNEENMLFWDFMNPHVVDNELSIVYAHMGIQTFNFDRISSVCFPISFHFMGGSMRIPL